MSNKMQEQNDNNLSNEFDKIPLVPELIGITAINPFCNYNSSSRSLMLSSHLSQSNVLLKGEESIIQSGLEKELAKNTFSKKLHNDSRIISIIPRYRAGVDNQSVNHTVDALVIFEDLKTNELDCLDIPYNSNMHPYFGYRYKWNTDILNNVNHNDIIKAGTILADSPAVIENNGYEYGTNMNYCLMSLNETAEDGVVLSRSAAKKLDMEIFEKRTVEFGTDTYLLNLYGDEDNYKPFPEIGEYVREDGVLLASRDMDEEMSPCLTSKKDMMDFNPMFDKVSYVKAGVNKVVDIKVHHTPKAKKELYSNTGDLVKKYSKAFLRYQKDILDVYDNVLEEHRTRYRNDNVKVTPKFSRVLIDAMAMTECENVNSNKYIKKTYRNDGIDMFKVDITVLAIHHCGVGSKISDKSGEIF